MYHDSCMSHGPGSWLRTQPPHPPACLRHMRCAAGAGAAGRGPGPAPPGAHVHRVVGLDVEQRYSSTPVPQRDPWAARDTHRAPGNLRAYATERRRCLSQPSPCFVSSCGIPCTALARQLIVGFRGLEVGVGTGRGRLLQAAARGSSRTGHPYTGPAAG